jgi:hypothetical protein
MDLRPPAAPTASWTTPYRDYYNGGVVTCSRAVAECHTLTTVPAVAGARGRSDDTSGCPQDVPAACPCNPHAMQMGENCADTCKATLSLDVTCRQRVHGRADACCYALPRQCSRNNE